MDAPKATDRTSPGAARRSTLLVASCRYAIFEVRSSGIEESHMRTEVLLLVLATTSTVLADDLDPKGIVSEHALNDSQCWNVLDAYSAMSPSGQARIASIVWLCQTRLQGKQRAIKPDTTNGPVMHSTNSQATQPGYPTGGGNVSEPMLPHNFGN